MADEQTLKLDDFIKFTGIELKDGMSQDDFHNAFREKFILKEKAHEDEGIRNTSAGRRIGTLETEFKKIAREMGVDFGQDFADKPLEDLFSHGFKSVKDKYESQINELKTSFDPSKKDAAIVELEKKYKSLEKQYNEKNKLFDDRINEFESYKQKTEKENKEFKLRTLYGNVLKSAKFKQGATDLERKGFEAHLNDKYKFDFDESDSLWAYDKKTGERIPHPEKMNDFMMAEDIVNKELNDVGLGIKNDKAETNRMPLGSSVAKTDNTNGVKRKVHSRAQV